ncbi:uncharacterized protein TrAtP1_012495 [Trichoderma atroviride]|uniref:uncharacterized protein n=1 Tax=Hypocrea atroviridis TaxID=63577 RepID=UPI00331C895B|nr:hypothetical protein TrAtP1_012495 [Trichoderma atroviride]
MQKRTPPLDWNDSLTPHVSKCYGQTPQSAQLFGHASSPLRETTQKASAADNLSRTVAIGIKLASICSYTSDLRVSCVKSKTDNKQ